MFEVSGLRAGYDRLEVLHGVGLRVGRGELVALLGSNGAGKTTLLRTVSGLIRPGAGTVTLDGADLTGLPAEKVAAAGLAHVPENRLVFPSLSVADNLRLGAWTRRRHASDDVGRMLELFPRLAQRLDQPAGTMSGGEQQMLAIARGLMARPKVLVLDEPSLGLAPKVIADIFAALAALREELTILLVEQNAHAAFKVANRVYVMDRGEIVTEGEPSALKDDPRTRAAYFGGIA
ncbi:ABC transporter ATP-binding protein [Nonomuraea sp. NBC_01738]|uniref:ABC transporter ATP-binding protein n=1 Tax=Nonomuraea sp. NBC_01738 TaxID=2976003 RepID=UPI002E138584|nr:ABC transporter ATP-binding protein [Nonomuraea sp. NBC_01738]